MVDSVFAFKGGEGKRLSNTQNQLILDVDCSIWNTSRNFSINAVILQYMYTCVYMPTHWHIPTSGIFNVNFYI